MLTMVTLDSNFRNSRDTRSNPVGPVSFQTIMRLVHWLHDCGYCQQTPERQRFGFTSRSAIKET